MLAKINKGIDEVADDKAALDERSAPRWRRRSTPTRC